MADVELLPCPFCGSAPRFDGEHVDAVCVLCGECGASSDFSPAGREDEAAAAWNTRANLAPLHAENERLAEVLCLHIEDLERSAVVLDQYPAMAPTAAEMRKAAAELRAALHPTAAQAAEVERLRAEVERLRLRDAQINDLLNRALVDRKKADERAERLAEALREAADDLEREIDARIVVAQLRAALAKEDRNG